MAHVRTATVLGGLAIALAQASMTSAQTWYNPDINSAYPATPAEAQATAPGLPGDSGPRTSAWQAPATATWSGAVDAAATLPSPAATGLDAREAPRVPSYSPAGSPGVMRQVSATAPDSAAADPAARVACAPGSDCAMGSAVGPASLGGNYIDPVLGWGNASSNVANVATAGDQTHHGVFFRWDRLYFTMTDPSVRTIGDPMQAGVGISNGITYPFVNSMDSAFIGGPEFGDRIEFGFIDPKQRNGWVASVLMLDRQDSVSLIGGALQFNDPSGMLLGFQDANGDNIDDDLNMNSIYGRFGQDLGTSDGAGGFMPPLDGRPDQVAPQDNGDLVTWIPIFGELEASSYTDVSGLEISYVHGRPNCEAGACGVNWLLGVRYLDIDDRFHVLGRGGIYDETELRTTAQNLVIGPQVGMVMARSIGPWAFAGELRYVPGVNFVKGRQRGVFASNADTVTQASNFNRPLNLNAFAIANTYEEETFSNIIEWRVDSSFALTQFLAIRAGYTGMFMSEIVRGAGNITYTLPGLGFASTDGEDMTLHALTLGLEFYR